MPNSEKLERPPLTHYNANWWKIDGQPIWYLAGRNYELDGPTEVGKWYFTNEAELFSNPYDTYDECIVAYEEYEESLIL